MRVLKFGGKSLKQGEPMSNVLKIIAKEHKEAQIAVVVSAIGSSTDQLQNLYQLALTGGNFNLELQRFEEYQNLIGYGLNLDSTLSELHDVLKSLQILNVHSQKVEDKILSYGEIISAKIVAHLLQKQHITTQFADTRKLIKVQEKMHEVQVNKELSSQLVNAFFAQLKKNEVAVITGFIGSNEANETVTLGRNGSNYSATLIASFTGAKEVQNWTDVSGIYTANPKYVSNAMPIKHLSFKEARELANFGANILHPNTIEPLSEKNIPLKIVNSMDSSRQGTFIDSKGARRGIRAVSVIEDVILVTIQRNESDEKIGIDARIFSVLDKHGIKIRLISQAVSDCSIGFVVDAINADKSLSALNMEFNDDIKLGLISSISLNKEMAVIAILGRHNYSLEKAIHGLRKNKIWLHLISNSISGEHISLVVDNKNLKKGVNIVHDKVFGVVKTLNVFALGKGTVGSRFIEQLLETTDELVAKRNLKINIIGVSDSKTFIFRPEGISSSWQDDLEKSGEITCLPDILEILDSSALENLVIVDNTASEIVAEAYVNMLNTGLDIVASNKKANAASFSYYDKIRKVALKKERHFFYETNVGAGLPIINTLQLLANSADTVYKIRGVFSGSLSYIFNHFSSRTSSFSDIMLEASKNGYTEPDPREDLSGMDVARKLIILAREIGLKLDISDIEVENLIPEPLKAEPDFKSFIKKRNVLDQHFNSLKLTMNKNEVLRYVGEVDIVNNRLSVSLIKVSRQSALGNIKNADAIFEIYTESYGNQPIVIQGAGAGAEVTARGVFGDLLRVAAGK